MKNKIIVTGGAGFVGSHLCERLSKNPNNQVYSIDNYFTGTVDNHVPGVEYIDGNTFDIENLVNFKPKIIYHLGEYSRVEQSFDDIEIVFKFNQVSTFAVLEFVRKVDCKLVYAGSSTKFGDQGFGKHDSPYAWTKSANTELVKNYGKWFDISYAITYFYNVYGKREISHGKYATLIALFTELMKSDKPLTVVSPGTQIRNFTHIDDIVDALILIGKEGIGDGYGIGSPEAYSILEVAKLFDGDIKMLPERKGNRQSADILTVKTIDLGWSAKYKLEDYISTLRANNWIKL